MKYYSLHAYLISLPLIISGYYIITAIYFPYYYIVGTYEDLYGEWLQTFSFLCAGGFALKTSRIAISRYDRYFFLTLMAACLYVFLEEISWGQRLLVFDSPDFFLKNNYQDETNLHNLLTGPVDVWTKTLLTYLISVGLSVYGAIYPICLHYRWTLALWFRRYGLVPPPISLSLCFLSAALYELELFYFNEAEVAELLVAQGLLYTCIVYDIKHSTHQSQSVMTYCIIVEVLIIFFALAITQSLLNSPEQRAKIEERLANGYKKFADRYESYDYYAGVAKTLYLYNEAKPDNTVVLRRLRESYLLIGQMDKAEKTLNTAIDVALQRYEKNPENIPALISLAKSYHKIQRADKVRFYAKKAYDKSLLRITIEHSEKKAYAYYWLAKACEQLNKQVDALKYYRLAYKTEKNNRRYRRAYYQKKRLMEKYYEEDWTTGFYTD